MKGRSASKGLGSAAYTTHVHVHVHIHIHTHIHLKSRMRVYIYAYSFCRIFCENGTTGVVPGSGTKDDLG